MARHTMMYLTGDDFFPPDVQKTLQDVMSTHSFRYDFEALTYIIRDWVKCLDIMHWREIEEMYGGD